MSDEVILPYNGTEGYVSGSDTSRARAIDDVASGKTTYRQKVVLDALHQYPHGLTWKELGLMLGLHHGQVSATLSVLHKAGKVFSLRTKVNGSHPYVSKEWVNMHDPSQIILEPSKTLSGKKRTALQAVLEAAREADLDYNLDTASRLRQAIADFDAISDT